MGCGSSKKSSTEVGQGDDSTKCGGDGPDRCKDPKHFYIDAFTEGGVNIYIFAGAQSQDDQQNGESTENVPEREDSVERVLREHPSAALASNTATSTHEGLVDSAETFT
ncbi:unnamed protein product [Lymnaea stagnalis]|uniref:Uncharacterized protein n=1 Tax=Lymnaea stagnalis TaxID=6523 RepID=A0AAV2I180_LYMST